MKIMTVACALGATLMLCNLGTSGAEAAARKAQVVHEPRRVVIRVPVIRPTPWEYCSTISLSP
jgi:predicted alpha/beta-fold hydrolase